MYEIRQTLGVKGKKFSLWCRGKEIVRSLSKSAAIKLVESFQENHETLQKRSQVLDEAILPFIEKGGGTGRSGCDLTNPDKHGDQIRAGSVSISQIGEDVGSPCRGSDANETETAAKLYQERLIAEYRKVNNQLRLGVDEIIDESRTIVKEIVKGSRTIIENSRTIIENSRTIVEESRTIAAVAQIALDTASKLNSENAGLRNEQRINPGNDRRSGENELALDIFTIDIAAEASIE